MSTIDDGGPAFPCEGGPQSGLHAAPGMSLRQWFAGQAMSGLLANSASTIPPGRNRQELPGIVATAAVLMADALIHELKGGAT